MVKRVKKTTNNNNPIINQKNSHREFTDNKMQNLTQSPASRSNALQMCTEAQPGSLYRGCCRSASHWWAHPLLLCREVTGGKPKPRQGWAGMERHQHTGARLPESLSPELLLRSPGSLEEGNGEGLVVWGYGSFQSQELVSFTRSENKLNRRERHSCSLLS